MAIVNSWGKSWRFTPLLKSIILQVILIGFVLLQHFGKGCANIHHKVRHFEIIDEVHVHSISARNSHYIKTDHYKVVTFTTLERNFRLLLKPKSHLFSEHFKAIVTTDENKYSVNVSATDFYSGTVDDDVNSKVFAHWEDSMLFATIATTKDNYIVEPAWRHLDGKRNANSMIFYRESDAIHEYGRNGTFSGQSAFTKCGNAKENKIAREKIFPEIDLAGSNHRRRREVPTGKTACSLLLVADFRFHQIFGNGQPLRTANYMIAVIERVNVLFQSIDWSDSQLKGLGFIIEEIQINSSPTAVSKGDIHYNMNGHTWDPVELLETFSKDSKHGRFCLTHLFTYQSFAENVVGLAYTASPSLDIPGGICSPLGKSGEQYFSYNTAWSSYENVDGKRILLKEAILITAHELGHNWGSEHDPSSGDCSPSSLFSKGKYIMYPYSVNGYEPNNKKFSFCSKVYMTAVLLNKRTSCFKEMPEYDTCGNGQLDKGEQCDGGYLSLIGQDPCCDKSCALIGDAKCSSMQGNCCINCRIAPINTICHEGIIQDVSCLGNSYCNGVDVRCPLQPHKPNGTDCIDGGTCYGGVCVSFCEARGLLSCICNNVAESCLRCCRVNSSSSCEKYSSKLLLSNGRPCLQGYCQNGLCKRTVKNLIQRLFKFANGLSISKLIEFFRSNIVGSVVVFSLLFWIPICIYIEYKDKIEDQKERKEKDVFEKLKQEKEGSPLSAGPFIQSTDV